MSDVLSPASTVEFTITAVPRKLAARKTIARLMQLQPEVQKGLKVLQKKRDREDNNEYIRAGVRWNARVRATRITRVEKDATFTLRLTPQIIPDVKSVEKYLSMKAAG